MSKYAMQRIVRKSVYWSGHGKHAQIDPRLLNPPKVRRRAEWFRSIRELMRRAVV